MRVPAWLWTKMQEQTPERSATHVVPESDGCTQTGTVEELGHFIRIGGWRNVAVVDPGGYGVVDQLRACLRRRVHVGDEVNRLRDLVVLVNGATLPADVVSRKTQVLTLLVTGVPRRAFWADPRAPE